jgi:hypothetical protein
MLSHIYLKVNNFWDLVLRCEQLHKFKGYAFWDLGPKYLQSELIVIDHLLTVKHFKFSRFFMKFGNFDEISSSILPVYLKYDQKHPSDFVYLVSTAFWSNC